jgi:uncharacterized protein YjeT (DUF2065 family)
VNADALLTAFGLFLIAEGLLPLLAPRVWRDFVERMRGLADGQLRFFGLVFVLLGVLLLVLF